MLDAIQCRTYHRCDHGERGDRNEQIQRNPALAFAGGRGEEKCVGQRHRHRGVHREISHHRPGESGQTGFVGPVGGCGALHHVIHPRTHLTAAQGGGSGDGDPFSGFGGLLIEVTLGPNAIGVQWRQIPVGVDRVVGSADLDAVEVTFIAGVIRHAGMLGPAAADRGGGRPRTVVHSPPSGHGVDCPSWRHHRRAADRCGCADCG